MTAQFTGYFDGNWSFTITKIERVDTLFYHRWSFISRNYPWVVKCGWWFHDVERKKLNGRENEDGFLVHFMLQLEDKMEG